MFNRVSFSVFGSLAAGIVVLGHTSVMAATVRGPSLASRFGVVRTVNLDRPYATDAPQSPIRFKTTPNAVCELEGDTSRQPWRVPADSSGFVQYFVSIQGGRVSSSEALICTSPRSIGAERIAMTYHRSSAAAIGLRRTNTVIPMPTSADVHQFAMAHGFDLLTAPNDVLVAHHLPPRPDDYATSPEKSVGWLKAALSPITFFTTVGTELPDQHAGSYANVASGNWSGYNAAGVAGTYNTVRGYWTVPAVSPIYAGPTYSNMWVGIDGGYCGSGGTSSCSPNNVYQDGSESDVASSNGTVHYSYFGWWEDYPYNNETTLFNVSPGDTMYGTFYKNIQNGKVYGQYYLKDLTTGAASDFAIEVGANLAGNCAEWIIEAPTVGGSRAVLADYHGAQMTSAEVVTGTATLLFEQIPQQSSYTLSDVTMYGHGYADSFAGDGGNGNINYSWNNGN